MIKGLAEWNLMLGIFEDAFTKPSFILFSQLACAWIMCTGRRTVTHMIRFIPLAHRHPHDAYHRFLRAGAWSMSLLWKNLMEILILGLDLQGVLALDLDDTLFHKTGRKIEGAGTFQDAIRSTSQRVVYALGLNLVVLTLRVKPPWGGEPLGLPINMRLYRKRGPTHLDLAEQMIRQVAEWFPAFSLSLCGDGAYATLAGRKITRTHVTSRMRRDAALYKASSNGKTGPPSQERETTPNT